MTDMTPDAIADALIPVLNNILGARMEHVYGTIEELRQEVADAIVQIRDTAQVLHDNDTAIMARVMEREGEETAEFMGEANRSWERFVRGECERLGLRIVVPK